MSTGQSNPWVTLKSEKRFENPWIRVIKNDVINPSGGQGEYTVVHFRNKAVAVIPVDEEGHTWLVGQYRYAVDSYEWEIPEGGAPEGESPLDCAKRELLEETGLVAEDWRLILDRVQLSNSVTDERAYTYVAQRLTQKTATPEETEQLVLRRVPLQEAFQMASQGEIRDAFSLMSLFKLQLMIEQNELEMPHVRQ